MERKFKVYIGKEPGFTEKGYIFPFIKNIVTFLEDNNVSYTFNLNEKVDVALCIQWEPTLKIVKKLKKRGVKIVHRLDGRAKSLVKIYDKDNENRRINNLADWTVFQSQYVKEHTTKPVKTIFGTEAPICYQTQNSSIIYTMG